MADEAPTTETPPTASQPGAAAPAAFDPSALSPEAIAWFEAEKRKASDAAAAAARRAEQEKAKPRPTTTTTASPPASPPAADDVTAILAMRDAFDDAVGDLPIKSTQKALLRESVMRDRPADVAGYVTRFAERAGWNLAAPAVPQPAVPASPSVPAAPAVPSTLRAPPPPPPAVTDTTPILSMSPGDREALVQRIGVEEFHKRLMPELVKTRVRLTP